MMACFLEKSSKSFHSGGKQIFCSYLQLAVVSE